MPTNSDDYVHQDPHVRLNHLSTVWTMVLQAHGGPALAEADEQRRFIERYHGAVYRYFFTAVSDEGAATELFQEFALRFARGDLRNFDPRKGRFRDFLRVVLINLIRDYRRRLATRRLQPMASAPELEDTRYDEADTAFQDSWRTELLDRTWKGLANESREDRPYHVILKWRVEHPDSTSAEMADQLTQMLNPRRPYTAAGIRKIVQRAREAFGDLLVEEVARSLGAPTEEELEQELIDLRLHSQCRASLVRRRTRGE